MAEERNNHQIARKDAKNCFVESLNDCFQIGRVHLAFATYLFKKADKRKWIRCKMNWQNLNSILLK